MRSTPKQRRSAYALREFWLSCPVSPPSYAERRAAQGHTRGWWTQQQALGIARTLDQCRAGVASIRQPGQYAPAPARLRAVLPGGLELMEGADDAFGCLGDSLREGCAKSLTMPRDEMGFAGAGVLHDLLLLLLGEDDGLTYAQTDRYGAGRPPEEGDLGMDSVQPPRQELQADDLDYQ